MTTTDDRPERPTRSAARSPRSCASRGRDVSPRDRRHPAAHRRRPGSTASCQIKDAVLRMGSLVEEAILAAIAALSRHDATRPRRSSRRRADQRDAARGLDADHRTIATQQPVARDLRFLLTLDHVAYELERMGDHAASVAKQVRKLAPIPRSSATSTCRDGRDRGRARRRHPAGARRRRRDRCPRGRRPRRRDRRLYHRTFDEVVELMRADPANVERGTRILFAAHYLERIGDRVDEHRRGRRVPGDRRDRGPQPMSAGTPSGSCSSARATRPGASWPRRCSASTAARLRGLQCRHRAEGRQPADDPRPRPRPGSIHAWACSKSVDEFLGPAVRLRRSPSATRPARPARCSPARSETLHWGYEDPGEGRGHRRRSASPHSSTR